MKWCGATCNLGSQARSSATVCVKSWRPRRASMSIVAETISHSLSPFYWSTLPFCDPPFLATSVSLRRVTRGPKGGRRPSRSSASRTLWSPANLERARECVACALCASFCRAHDTCSLARGAGFHSVISLRARSALRPVFGLGFFARSAPIATPTKSGSNDRSWCPLKNSSRRQPG